MKRLMTLVFVLLMAGCMQVPQTDLEGLIAMRDVWQSAYDANDAAVIAAVYSENGALLPPNSESVNGQAAIEDFFRDFQATGMRIEIQDTEAYVHGDVGYTVGAYTITNADGATIDEGKYVAIWRYIDGTWRMHRDIFNTNLKLSAPDIDLEAEEQAIRSLMANWFADEVRRDMEASLSYMTPDVVIQAEGAPTISGIDAARSLYVGFFEIPYVDLELLPRTVVVAASGDLAYDIGPFNFVFEGENGRTEAPAKSTIIWRKLDGKWKAVAVSFSTDTPPATSSE